MNKFHTFNESMKNKESLSASEEDYIEMIYRLSRLNGYTRVTDIANNLNIKPSSVSTMIRRLAEKELIKHSDYGVIELSIHGSTIGAFLFERHNTLEEFLKLLNVKSGLLDEVEKMEHTLSVNTVASIKNLIDFFNQNPDIKDKFASLYVNKE